MMSLFFLPSVSLKFHEVIDLEGNARSSSFDLQVENSRSQGALTGCARSRAALVRQSGLYWAG